MFNQLSKRITGTLKRLTGRGKLNAKQISAAMDDIEAALLDADVGFKVTKTIRKKIEQRALGEDVLAALNPGDVVVKIVHDEMVDILSAGQEAPTLNVKVKPPAVILMVGLQGAGKTTTAAKPCQKVKIEDKLMVLLASTDTVRDAAMQQLSTLATEIDVTYFPADNKMSVVDIAMCQACAHAKTGI